MRTDWYTLARRVSLAVFILLTIWGVMQASGQLALGGGLPPYFRWDYTWYQFLYVALWPLTRAPIWYKITYFGLGFWLVLPYFMIIEVR